MQAFQPCLRSFQPQSCEQVKRFLLDDSLLTKTVSRSQNTGCVCSHVVWQRHCFCPALRAWKLVLTRLCQKRSSAVNVLHTNGVSR